MNRMVDDRNILDSFVRQFVGVLEKHAGYVIVSGFVAISHGRMRGTEDIDLIMERLSSKQYSALHEELTRAGFECHQEDPYEYLVTNTPIKYVLKGEMVPEMEVKFAKDELDNDQLARRVLLPLTGLDCYFSSIEANIAFKLLKSPKDLEDARHLRNVYADKIDEGEITRVKSLIGVFR